jgi:hypothetical protein
MKYESTKHALIHHPIHNIENPRKENKIFAKPPFSQGSSQEHEKSVPFGREEKSQKGLLRNNKLRWKPRATRGDGTKSSHYAAERCLPLTSTLHPS